MAQWQNTVRAISRRLAEAGRFPASGNSSVLFDSQTGWQGYRIAVKREEGGQVSNWLHNHANVGDVVKLVAPAGDFFMAVADDTPVTLISAGVGQTPMLAMLDTLAKAGHTAQVNWFHAAENGDVHAFADEVKELGLSLPRFTAHTVSSAE